MGIEIRTNQLELTLETYHDSGDGEYMETEDIWIRDETDINQTDEDWEDWRQQVKEAVDAHLKYANATNYRILQKIEIHGKVYTIDFLAGDIVRKQTIERTDVID